MRSVRMRNAFMLYDDGLNQIRMHQRRLWTVADNRQQTIRSSSKTSVGLSRSAQLCIITCIAFVRCGLQFKYNNESCFVLMCDEKSEISYIKRLHLFYLNLYENVGNFIYY